MFQVHKTLLQLCKHRLFYEEYKGQIPKSGLDAISELYLKVYEKFFKQFPETDTVQLDSLLSLMSQLKHSQDDLDKIQTTWGNIQEDPDEDTTRGLTKGLAELKASEALGKLLIEYEGGADIDLFDNASEIVDNLGRQQRIAIEPASDDWAVIKQSVHDPGKLLKFPLDCLNASAKNVTTRTQIILAARPDIGKTSLCAFFAVNYAKQIPDDRTVLVFNNEDTQEEWMESCYRSALGLESDRLLAMDTLEVTGKFYQEIGRNKIKIINAHNFNLRTCERLIQKHRPMVVFWDMLDNVRGYEEKQREDLILEGKYQHARGLAITYDFLSLPTSQINISGEGIEFPHKGMLKGSGTAKQGACKGILMMGHSAQPGKERERYFGFVKNKYTQKPGARKDCGKAVVFDWEIARFREP